MEARGHSPEAEVSRAMEEVLQAERAAIEAAQSASASAEQQRREAAEAAQHILERAERRIISMRQKIAVHLQEEIARLHMEARLAVDSHPPEELSPVDIDRLASEAATWLSTDDGQ